MTHCNRPPGGHPDDLALLFKRSHVVQLVISDGDLNQALQQMTDMGVEVFSCSSELLQL